MAVASTLDKITSALDNAEHTVGVFLDLKKAFDTVNFSILLDKLHHLGIRGIPLLLLKNYLSGRLQATSVQSAKSIPLLTQCGVPQGSILGPLLFIIYINDLPNALTHATPVMYADDTNIFLSNSNYETLESNINLELDRVKLWLKSNKLSLNLNKTHCMLFTLSRAIKTKTPRITIDNTSLAIVHHTSFLGVLIDDKLNWAHHIIYISSKISRSIGILYRASKLLNTNTLRTLYQCLVHPYLDYCLLVWGKAPVIYTNRLFILQKRALRVITGSPYLAHTSILFPTQKILKLSDLFQLRLSLFSYKLYTFRLPPSFSSKFAMPLRTTPHPTRLVTSKSFFNIPKFRTSLKQKSLVYLSVKNVNYFLIPRHHFNCGSTAIAKRNIKISLLSRY